jgi:DnaD/phage-associated family protein
MYTKIESLFWTDEKVIQLTPEARYLMLYILTSPHRNIIGCYFIPEPYACFDCGLDLERFAKGFRELLAQGLIKYDSKTKVLLVMNFLKFNPVENPNQVKSAIDKLNELPQSELLHDLHEQIRLLQGEKPFLEPLLKRLLERLGKGLPQPVISNQYTVISINTNNDSANVENEIAVSKDKPSIGAQAVAYAEQAWGRMIPPGEAEAIIKWCDEFGTRGSPDPDALVMEAIKRALDQNVRKLAYVNGILQDWFDKEIISIEHITALDAEWKAKKDKGKGKGKPKGPSGPGEKPSKDKYENFYL